MRWMMMLPLGALATSAALQQVRQSSLDPQYLEVVFVLGEGRFYKGYVTLAKLLKAAPDTPLCALLEGEPVAVSAYDRQESLNCSPDGSTRWWQ